MAAPYLEVFREQDRASARRVLQEPLPRQISETFHHAFGPVIASLAKPVSRSVHEITLGPAGEIPPDLRRDAAKSIISGRQPEILARAGIREVVSGEGFQEVPPLAVHLVLEAKPMNIGLFDSAPAVARLMKAVAQGVSKAGIEAAFPKTFAGDPSFDITVLRENADGATMSMIKNPTLEGAMDEYLDALYNRRPEAVNLVDVSKALYLKQKVDADKLASPNQPHIYIYALTQPMDQLKRDWQYNTANAKWRSEVNNILLGNEKRPTPCLIYSQQSQSFVNFQSQNEGGVVQDGS